MSQQIDIPSDDELVVNQKILARCNHTNWRLFEREFGEKMLICTGCEENFSYSWGHEDDDTACLPPETFLRMKILRYAQDDVLASLVLRTIESQGWEPMIRSDSAGFSCIFSKGQDSFSSTKSPTRAAAICSAAAMLGRSGRFSVKQV